MLRLHTSMLVTTNGAHTLLPLLAPPHAELPQCCVAASSTCVRAFAAWSVNVISAVLRHAPRTWAGTAWAAWAAWAA
eukprot:353459-Chlamydomonas_euryale.AAC.3